MGFYRKRPVSVEARQTGIDYDEDGSVFAWCGGRLLCPDDANDEPIRSDEFLFIIDTLEGPLWVTSGDWVIRGVSGEFYPCKSEIFEETYEPTTERASEVIPPR